MSDNNNDFSVPTIVSKVGEHAKDIASISKRLDYFENKFGNHEKTADTLLETSEKAVKMKDMIEKILILLIKSDNNVKDAVKDLIKESDRHWFYALCKRVGFGLWTVMVALVSVIATKLIS